MLRPEFVRRKLRLVADDLVQLAELARTGYEELVADPIRLAATERIVERIVLRAIDINEHLVSELARGDEERTARLTYRETFLRLVPIGVLDRAFAERIAASAGLRNIIVHEYNDLDHRILHSSLVPALVQYHAYVEAVDAWLTGFEG